MKRLSILLALLVGLLGFPGRALAHSVWTDFQIQAEQLQLTSLFSTDEPFQGAPVRVYAPNNPDRPWMEGKTDDQGNFLFKPDPNLVGDWQVRIGDRGDHADILTVPVTQSGVQVDLISQAEQHRMHWWVRQVGVLLGAFGSGLGSAVLFRQRRWFA